MDLILLQPLMLWAAGALAVPLLLHLMKRRRREPVPFPSLMLLHRARLSSARRVRVENLLLWILRTLVLASVVAAFCMPVVRFGGLAGFGGAAHRDVAIVLDVSASMSRRVGGVVACDLVRRAAMDIVDGLAEGDRAVLVLAGGSVSDASGELSADFKAVKAAIAASAPTNADARLGEAVASAIAVLGHASGREREIHVLTDGRASAWPRQPVVSGKSASGIPCFALLVAGHAADNAWIPGVSLRPATPVPGRPCEALVRVGRSGSVGDVTVTLTLPGGATVTRTVPAGLAMTVVPIPPQAPGPCVVRATISSDELTRDDVAELVTAVHANPPVLVMGTARESAALRLALDPYGRGAGVRFIGPGESLPSLAEVESVFLVGGGHDTARMRSLETFVRSGGALVIFPGDGDAPLPALPESFAPAFVTGCDLFSSDASATRLVRESSGAAPWLDEVFPPGGSSPALGIRRVLKLDRLWPGATSLLAAGDGRPLLVRRACGRGAVFLCAVGADRTWSTAPLSNWFLPLMQRLAVASPAIVRSALEPGISGVPSSLARGAGIGDALYDPAGVRVPATSSGEVGPLREPGVYTTGGPGREGRPVFAVARCTTGSDLTPVDPDAIPSLTGLSRVKTLADVASHREAVASHREGVTLAEPLLWLALILAVCEWLLSNRLYASRSVGGEKGGA